MVAPFAQAPLVDSKGKSKVPAYDGGDSFGLVVAVQTSVDTAHKDLVTRIDKLANKIKDKNKSSQNTVSTAEHSALETKLNLTKRVIQMLMTPYHATCSTSAGTGSPRPVKEVLEPYVAGAKFLAAQPKFGFAKDEIKKMFGTPPKADEE